MSKKFLQLGTFMILIAALIFLGMNFSLPANVYSFTKPPEVKEQQEVMQTLILPKTHETEVEHSHTFLAEITAYSAKDSCHFPNCVMANGLPAAIGYIACPRNIALGTKVKIENLGEFICGDRTAKWVDGRYDIFMGYSESAYREAINFGKQLLEVEIIN